MTVRGIHDANGEPASLAECFVTAPHLADPDKASRRLSEWLSDIAPAKAAGFAELFARFPLARQIFTSLAEASPFLFELIRSDAGRALRILQSEPDRHLSDLIEQTRQQVWASSSEGGDADASRHESGSRTSHRTLRHRRRLAGH